MESTQVLECTQVLDSSSGIEERPVIPVATLTIEGTDYTIWNRENKIGRDAKCSIVLNSKAVSVEHALIEADLQGGHFIIDLGSTNKTRLGDVQLKPFVRYFINDGDSLKLANLKGVYHHAKIVADPIPAESSTQPMAELTEIPGTPERKEEDVAVASIVAETPYKGEGNGVDSDGDIFGDSSALFVRPLKLPSVDTKSPGERISERVGDLLEDPTREVAVCAGASPSISGDHSVVKEGNAIDESSVGDIDSSDLVAGSQPLFTPEKQSLNPKLFDCNTEPPVAIDFEEELTEPPQRCSQWENIDDSINEISDRMNTIDSLVEKNEIHVTYTPPKRKADSDHPKVCGIDPVQSAVSSENETKGAPEVCNEWGSLNDSINEISQQMDTIDAMVEKNELHVTYSSPKNKTDSDRDEVGCSDTLEKSPHATKSEKFVKTNIVRNLEEELDVQQCKDGGVDTDIPKSNQAYLIPPGNKTVYDMATEEIVAENVPDVEMGGDAVSDSSVNESTDFVPGSQSMVSTAKNGEEENIFGVNTVPVAYDVDDQSLSKLNIFDMATQQVSRADFTGSKESIGGSGTCDRNEPCVVLDSKINNACEEHTANGDPTIVGIGIPDLPTQAIPSSNSPCDRLAKPIENVTIQNCDVSISDMATQAVSNDCEVSSVHQASISDMPSHVVQKNQNEEHSVKLDEIEEDPCNISLSDMATQQGSVHRNIQDDEVSELPDRLVQSKKVTSESKHDVPDTISSASKKENVLQNSEDIYNVMTQLPVEDIHVVFEESNTQMIEAEVQQAVHEESLSVAPADPNRVGSDCAAYVSLSDLPTQAVVASNDQTPADMLKSNNQILMEQDTEDIFNVMTQLPTREDEFVDEAAGAQPVNSEVEKSTVDVSLSEMMTQPSKSTSDVNRESPIADMSISDLPTQATTATSDEVIHQDNKDSEDIYNVVTQLPVENEKILPNGSSSTQQLNADLENSDMEIGKEVSNDHFGSTSTDAVPSTCFKPVDPLERTKNDEFAFKIPSPTRNLGKTENRKEENIDVYMMDTQPEELQYHNVNQLDGSVAKNESSTKSEPSAVPECCDGGSHLDVSALATQEAANTLPSEPINDKDADGDIFDVDTVPHTDVPENVPHEGDNSSTHSVHTEDDVAKKCEKESGSVVNMPLVPCTQEIDPSSVEGRIRALSDKNVNSFATQQNLVSSNTRSTVAELLETLEDTSTQVGKIKKKVKKLEYSDSEDSSSPEIRVLRNFKTLAESINEEDTESPLIAPKKPCKTLNDTQEEVEIVQRKLSKTANDPEAELEILCNGKKHSSRLDQSDSPIVVESLKTTVREPSKHIQPVEVKKDASNSGSKSGSNGVVKDSCCEKVNDAEMGRGQPGVTESTKTCKEEEENVLGKSVTDNTGESELLQLNVSADGSLNKLDTSVTKSTADPVGNDSLQVSVDTSLNKPTASIPTTPEKSDASGVTAVTPSVRTQNEIAKPSPETPEIPEDFFGTPKFHDNPPLRQYVNRKKLSLSSTALLKGPSAYSTPKSELDSRSQIDMEETLQSAVRTNVINEKIVDAGCSTPKNIKKFKKASPQKRKSSEIVEPNSPEGEFLSSQDSTVDSQEFGRGKRKRTKKSFFGFDDNEEVDAFTVKPIRKILGSEETPSSPVTTSSPRSAAPSSPTSEEKVGLEEKIDFKNNSSEASNKRQSGTSSDSLLSKKIKLSTEVKVDGLPSSKETCDMELTCVSNRLKGDAELRALSVKKFRRASPRKPEPVGIEVTPNKESTVKTVESNEAVNKTRERNRGMSASESDSVEEISRPLKKVVSSQSSSAGAASSSPVMSLRGRKCSDKRDVTASDSDVVSSIHKAKQNKVQDTKVDSQKKSKLLEESSGSQEISIKSMSRRLQGALKNNLKLDEGKDNQKGKNRRNSHGRDTPISDVVVTGKGGAGEHTELGISESAAKVVESRSIVCDTAVGTASTAAPQMPVMKKDVKQKGRVRKMKNQTEVTHEMDEVAKESILKPSESQVSVPVRRGRRKLVLAKEDSIAITDKSETEPPASPKVTAPKRGRKTKTDNLVSVTDETVNNRVVVTKLSDSQNAPNTSTSKTRGRGRNTPAVVEDLSALETDQDSQLENSQGRRSGRARKKKESFDEIMSRKEEELKLKKLQRNSALSASTDTSRSASRASVASSSHTEESVVATSTTRGRGRSKKNVSVASTSTVSLAGEDTTFNVPISVPSSPAGSNSSKRKTPRPGSASSTLSVDSQSSAKKKQKNQTSTPSLPMKVMFTGLADSKLSSMVKKLGGKVVEKPTDCTVLVTDKVRRTVKFLCALGLGKPIVSPNWLSKSKAFNQFTDPYDSVLNDSEAESKFDFQLKASLEIAQNSRLLEGYSFYTTASVMPPPAEIKPIVECCGGTFLAKPPAKWPPNAAVISSPKDKSDWAKLSRHGVLPPILSAEALLSGVLKQGFDLRKHRLK